MYKLFSPYTFKGLTINTESYTCTNCDCTCMTQSQVSKTNWELSSKALDLVEKMKCCENCKHVCFENDHPSCELYWRDKARCERYYTWEKGLPDLWELG